MALTSAQLTLTNDKGEISKLELPIYHGTLGPDVIDIEQIYKQDVFTFDLGFRSTAACKSAITYIDGDQGILLHRGYAISDLANNVSFLELSYLLLYKNLPNQTEYDDFVKAMNSHTMIHEEMISFFNGFRRDAHPMAIMCSAMAALSAFYHDSLDMKDAKHRELAAIRLIAKVPTIAAICHKYSLGQPFIYPKNNFSYTQNFLHMMFSTPCEESIPNPVITKALDVIFMLHADHEQNASTSTVRLAGSSGANPFACIAAGVAALWGPAHGGANEAVLNMLNEIGDPSNIEQFITKVKDPASKVKLMGFGHRVYKNFDPRATILRDKCHTVLQELKITNSKLLDIALKLEEIALKDEYFIKRKLYPNVDFYSGIILQAIGIPTNMFTVIFALARTSGWVAQWLEMTAEPNNPIGRPRQLYIGEKLRPVTKIAERK